MDLIGVASAGIRIPDLLTAGDLLQSPGRPVPRSPWRHAIPADVVVGPGFVTVRADLPGIPGENIEVIVTPKYVEIIGWPAETAMSGGYLISERQHEVVRRMLRLPEEVVAHASVARLAGGVLEVRVPRRPLDSGWTKNEREA
jgi:HSP20 family molecular chaperone IbpA